MESTKMIRSRLAYLGWTIEELAVKAHMSRETLQRRLKKPDDFRLGELHMIESALGWERGTIGRL